MIEINKAENWRRCNCCYSDKDVVEISFRNEDGSQGTTVALCGACASALNVILHQRYGKTPWVDTDYAMPPEKDSMFAKFKGTEKWREGMFEKRSNDVLVTVEYEDGTRATEPAHTCDGKWSFNYPTIKRKIVAWSPFPKPKEGHADE